MKAHPALICAMWLFAAISTSAQFFDDFNGTQLDYSRWFIAEKQWGSSNNGVVHNNVVVSNGILHLFGNGNLYTGPIAGYAGSPGQRVGAAIATTNYYASGSYEVRLKLPAQTGGTSAIWPFHYEEVYSGTLYTTLANLGGLTITNLTWIGLTTNQANSLLTDLTSTNGSRQPYLNPPTNGLYRTTSLFRGLTQPSQMVLSNDFGLSLQIFVVLANAASLNQTDGGYIRNEEIDIETPTARNGSTDITYANARFNTWVGQNNGEYTANYDSVGYVFNDGQFHTYRFDWHTASPTVLSQRVEFYIDGVCYQTNYTHIPTIGGRFWIGYWFSGWSGTPNFVTQEMDVDWVRITPFNENGDQFVPETYPNDGWWAPSMAGNPPPAITGISPNSGSTNGGTIVTISGTNFYTGATVRFGAGDPIPASFSSNQTQLIVTTPSLAASQVAVTVSNVDGKTAVFNSFTFSPPPPPAKLISAAQSGSNLSLIWAGGTNLNCTLLTSTNIAQPTANWIVVATNIVGINGLSTNSILINTLEQQRFYLLAIPN
ncbi:MAG TPA: IPT/TIG domain-containing protein [Verrucomicrobiae bacterium]|nr:IPT/TIG domain-containing protein [Verrucomicrobiae bacterium]